MVNAINHFLTCAIMKIMLCYNHAKPQETLGNLIVNGIRDAPN